MSNSETHKRRGRLPKIEVVDLFCGIGGLSYGMKSKGFKILTGFDLDWTCQYAYVILNRELLPSQSDRGRLVVTHNGKDIELSYEFVENNTLRDAATTIVGDSTAKALSFDLYEVKLGNKSPKVNMSLKKSGDKYIVIEEKRWEFHGLNN